MKEKDKIATLRRGNEGEQIARLQALLCLAGFDAKPIDGDFGAGTERAVRACQESKGLPTTGQADVAMQEVLGMSGPDMTKVPVPVIDNITVGMVAQMFSSATPRRNIETYLPGMTAALKQSDMDDRDLVLMALGNDLKTARKLVNGGSHGLDRFTEAFEIGRGLLG